MKQRFEYDAHGTRLTIECETRAEADKRAARIMREFAGRLGHPETIKSRQIRRAVFKRAEPIGPMGAILCPAGVVRPLTSTRVPTGGRVLKRGGI